jgi:hypothetical protein
VKPGAAIAGLLLAASLSIAAAADNLEDVWHGTYWDETSSALMLHFGVRAMALPQPIDFGDSYVNVVLRDVSVGGYKLTVFFQMDKATHGLKRIQVERNRHGVNPPAFRAVAEALDDEFGAPDVLCGIRPGPASGYQEAAERIWLRDSRVIRAVFRDMTIEAFEGCVFPGAGPCGLVGQLLVRISPPGGDAATCPVPPPRAQLHER